MQLTFYEAYLLALALLFATPYLIWRLARTEYFAPLVVVQIITGIALGPEVLGQFFPVFQHTLFTPAVLQAVNGVAIWAVMLFLWTAGIELELADVWQHRRDTLTCASFALGVPMLIGTAAAFACLASDKWMGASAGPWQFSLAIGMACAVTALPILMLFLERLAILPSELGQRVLRYASLDDIVIWIVMSLVLLDVRLLARQSIFLSGFAVASFALRRLLPRIPAGDRWYLAMIWIPLCSCFAAWGGFHFIVGAFISGLVLDARWFNAHSIALFRKTVMLVMMPAFFLSTGLRTEWNVSGLGVLEAGALLLAVSICGKLAGVHVAGRLLGWATGEASLIGWLLQTKALIVIIFAQVLLDKQIITSSMFAAILLMALVSTALSIPRALPALRTLQCYS